MDLWGSAGASTDNFDGDTLTNVFSSTKSVTAIAMAMAVDRGWLAYEDPIAKHWPEFAAEGKAEVTVAELMRHESGFDTFPEPLNIESLQPAGLKANAVGSRLAGFKQHFPEAGRKRYYHALTRGIVANEIFRRIHPDGLTLGEFVEQELAQGLGIDVHIGCSKSNFMRGKAMGTGQVVKECTKKSLGMGGTWGMTLGEFYALTRMFLASLREMEARPLIEGLSAMQGWKL